MKNSFHDELKAAGAIENLRQLVEAMYRQIFGMERPQNPGSNSLTTKNIESSRKTNFWDRNYHSKSSNTWNEYYKRLQELQMNCTTENKLSLHNNEPCVVPDVEFTQPLLAMDGKMTSQLKDKSIRCNNLNKQKHKQTMPRSYPKLRFKRSEIAKIVPFLVILCIISVGLFFDTWIEPSLMTVQHGQIWASSLRLFGFMAFVWAVSIMILDGVPFVRMQSLLLIFWAISMHLKS